MLKTALFAGSFDPFTVGHEEIVERSLPLFDRVVVAVGVNAEKRGFLPVEKRLEIIHKVFQNEPRVLVSSYTGMTVDFCRQIEARFLIRGLRSVSDYLYECEVAGTNRMLAPDIETVFLFSSPTHACVASSMVRDILMHGGNPTAFLPASISPEDLRCNTLPKSR